MFIMISGFRISVHIDHSDGVGSRGPWGSEGPIPGSDPGEGPDLGVQILDGVLSRYHIGSHIEQVLSSWCLVVVSLNPIIRLVDVRTPSEEVMCLSPC